MAIREKTVKHTKPFLGLTGVACIFSTQQSCLLYLRLIFLSLDCFSQRLGQCAVTKSNLYPEWFSKIRAVFTLHLAIHATINNGRIGESDHGQMLKPVSEYSLREPEAGSRLSSQVRLGGGPPPHPKTGLTNRSAAILSRARQSEQCRPPIGCSTFSCPLIGQATSTLAWDGLESWGRWTRGGTGCVCSRGGGGTGAGNACHACWTTL